MIPCVRVKEGVSFAVIAPGGFEILRAISHLAWTGNHDVTITSGCDGAHSGPNDPHHRGEAYDVRTHDLPDKHAALKAMQNLLGENHFFVWIEDENGANEHIHAQVKKWTTYPPVEPNDHDAVQEAVAEP